MKIIVSRAIRLHSEGGEIQFSPSPFPQLVPDEFTAAPYYRMLVADGAIVEEVEEAKAEAVKEAAEPEVEIEAPAPRKRVKKHAAES